MSDGLTPATAIFSDRVSGKARGGNMRLMRDERGLIGIIGIAIIGIIALFGFSTAAAINWRFILALFAMAIVGIAFVGMIFFKASPKLVILAAVVSFGIIFVVEVSVPVVVGGIMVIAAMYYLKVLIPKRPLIFTLMVLGGLVVMLFGYKAILLPMGILP